MVGFAVLVLVEEAKLRAPVPGLRNRKSGLDLRLDSVVVGGNTVSMTSSSEEEEATCSVIASTFSSSCFNAVEEAERRRSLAVGRILKRALD